MLKLLDPAADLATADPNAIDWRGRRVADVLAGEYNDCDIDCTASAHLYGCPRA